jgi:hypothetical protein
MALAAMASSTAVRLRGRPVPVALAGPRRAPLVRWRVIRFPPAGLNQELGELPAPSAPLAPKAGVRLLGLVVRWTAVELELVTELLVTGAEETAGPADVEEAGVAATEPVGLAATCTAVRCAR